MSRNQRFALLAVAAVIAVGAVVVLGTGGDDDEDAAKSPVGAGTAPTVTTRSPESLATRIEVANSEPVGGVKKISVKKGERIRFFVQSADTTDEVHLHGYDVAKELSPGHPVRFDVPATLDGVFEAELEDAKQQILQLTVEP
jgi:hypothetical protein